MTLSSDRGVSVNFTISCVAHFLSSCELLALARKLNPCGRPIARSSPARSQKKTSSYCRCYMYRPIIITRVLVSHGKADGSAPHLCPIDTYTGIRTKESANRRPTTSRGPSATGRRSADENRTERREPLARATRTAIHA